MAQLPEIVQIDSMARELNDSQTDNYLTLHLIYSAAFQTNMNSILLLS